MRGAALLQLQSIPTTVRANYNDLKAALWIKFVPQERVELHKAEFRARRREKDEKLSDLSSSLRRLARKAYPEAAEELQDSLAKDQFIDALEDREIRLKLRESGPKTLDEAVSRALQIEAMYEAESRRGKGRSVRLVQEPPPEKENELLELIRQNTAAINQMVAVVQQQQPSASKDRNVTKQTRVARGTSGCGFVSSAIKRVILWQNVNKLLPGRETGRDRRCGSSVGREIR